MLGKLKYKKLTKQQIIISIDRLTRFKPTEEKYIRVFSDIILTNLIEPKIKKTDLLNMHYSEIRDIATKIFNGSFAQTDCDTSINSIIKNNENRIYINNQETQILLENELNYKQAIKLLDTKTNVPNLKWLISLYKENTQKIADINKIIIAEGITEEILLPAFSDIMGYNFIDNGIKIIAAGGKNQVVKLYYRLKDKIKVPIFILLDNDAKTNKTLINKKLRKQDKIHLLDCGEFEDLLPKSLIKKAINNEFKNFVSIKISDLKTENSTVKTLEKIFKEKCLHEFKKAEFAQRIKEQITKTTTTSDELKDIINEIKNF